jgi:hypothetical protein
MPLELDEGRLYTLRVRRHAKLSDAGEVSFSDLEFVEPEHFDDVELVTFIDLEYVGPGLFEWTAEPVPVFLDRSELLRGRGPFYRMFRESEIIDAKPAQPE